MAHDVFKSVSFRVRTPDGTMNVIVMEDDNGNPFEIQAFIGKAGSSLAAWAAATCAMVSVALRNKVPLQTIINELADITSDGTARIGATGNCRSGPEGVYSALIQYRNDIRERTAEPTTERLVLRDNSSARADSFGSEAVGNR